MKVSPSSQRKYPVSICFCCWVQLPIGLKFTCCACFYELYCVMCCFMSTLSGLALIVRHPPQKIGHGNRLIDSEFMAQSLQCTQTHTKICTLEKKKNRPQEGQTVCFLSARPHYPEATSFGPLPVSNVTVQTSPTHALFPHTKKVASY